MKNKQTEQAKLLTKILEFSDDQTGKTLFTIKRYLAQFLKHTFTMFKNLTIEEIIEQTIDWDSDHSSFLAKLQSEESNTRKGPQLREDFVILLRFPDYMQSGENDKLFILHIEFENSNSDIERREAEYSDDLFYRYNIAPYETEIERKQNQIPIFSVWILLNPNKKDKGVVLERNYEAVFKADKNDATYHLYEVRDKANALIKTYRIYLDDELSEAQMKIPNIQGLLQGFSKTMTETEFKNWIETYDLIDIPEFQEEVQKVNGFKQAFIDQGIKQGIDLGIKQGIDQGIDQGFKEGTDATRKELINNLAKSLLKDGTCQTSKEARDKAIELLQIGE